MKRILTITMSVCLTLQFISCQKEVYTPTPKIPTSDLSQGIYILNQGGFGSNNATVDYYDFKLNSYELNFYAMKNPTVTLGLGDIGNDLEIYGGKMYAVINHSNLVDVMDVKTGKSLNRIPVNNCRYITFSGGKAYVSSYNGAQYGGSPQLGIVDVIDTLSLQVTNQIPTGYQPEGVLATAGKLYVVNSGGYMDPNYGTTVSVFNLSTNIKTKDITVGVNPTRLWLDNDGKIWVNSIGNYAQIPGDVEIIDPHTDDVIQKLAMDINNVAITGDSLYYYGVAYNGSTPTINYGILNTKTYTSMSSNFITDNTTITMPSAIAIDPSTKKIYIGDAVDYESSGFVLCFNPNGTLDWKNQSGVIPAAFAFKK